MGDLASLECLGGVEERIVILDVPVVEGLLYQILHDRDMLDIDEPWEDLVTMLVNELLERPVDLLLDEPVCTLIDASLTALSIQGVEVDVFSILSFEIVDEFNSIEMRIT